MTTDDEIQQLIKDARALDDKDARKLIWKAIERDRKNVRLWRIYASWFDLTSNDAVKAYRTALDVDAHSLDDHPQGALLARLSGRVRPDFPVQETVCLYCNHYSAGHLDRQRDWFRCDKKHRLVDDADRSWQSWEDQSNGSGDAMLMRPDCPDWKFSGKRFYVPPDPWYG